jgi:hypothetical protein
MSISSMGGIAIRQFWGPWPRPLIGQSRQNSQYRMTRRKWLVVTKKTFRLLRLKALRCLWPCSRNAIFWNVG